MNIQLLKLLIELDLLMFVAENSTKDSKLLFYSDLGGALCGKYSLNYLMMDILQIHYFN